MFKNVFNIFKNKEEKIEEKKEEKPKESGFCSWNNDTDRKLLALEAEHRLQEKEKKEKQDVISSCRAKRSAPKSGDKSLYNRWRNMMVSCYNPSNSNYKNYGLRGIKVCERWHDVTNYLFDHKDVDVLGKVLRRKNKFKDFYPENCEWVPYNFRYIKVASVQQHSREVRFVEKLLLNTYNHFNPGDKCGKYIVLNTKEKDKFSSYFCQCECGIIKEVSAAQLRNNPTDSGCRDCHIKKLGEEKKENAPNLQLPKLQSKHPMMCAGEKFGDWTVIEATNKTAVLCRCKCGKEKNVYTQNLRSASSKMCITCFNKAKTKLNKDPVNIGDKIGCFIVTSKLDNSFVHCKCCNCAVQKLFSVSSLHKRTVCNVCKYKNEEQDAENKITLQNIIELTKDKKVFEKLPDKLSINIPNPQELNNYIEKAEELLTNASGISFENVFKDRDRGITLYWKQDVATNKFKLMASEHSEKLYNDTRPAIILLNCDLRLKIKACKHLKEFLDLFEMHISDYLDGKING